MLEYADIDPYLAKCVRCGSCRTIFGLSRPACPSGEEFKFEGFFSSGRIWIARGLKEGALEWDDPELVKKLFACTLCGNCTQQCPMTVRERIMEVFETLRAEIVDRGGTPFLAHRRLKDSLVQYRNPWMQPRRRRSQRLSDGNVRILRPDSGDKAEVLYFVGCTAALDSSLKHIARNTVDLLNKAGVDFGLLGEEEVCCGSVALRIGERALVRELASINLEMIEKTGAKTVVTSCAGCFKTLSQDYSHYGQLSARVVHSSEYILELLEAGRLSLIGGTKRDITYHDPCHLGRHCGIYDAPREILRCLPGISLREMVRCKENSWCCGAGGGVRSAFPDWALESSKKRILEAEQTGANLLVTACPFCLQNLSTGIQAGGTPLELMDLTDLVKDLLR